MDTPAVKNLEDLLAQSGEYVVGSHVFDPPSLKCGMPLVHNRSHQLLQKVANSSEAGPQYDNDRKYDDDLGSRSFLADGGVNVDKINECILKLDRLPAGEPLSKESKLMGIGSFLQSQKQKAIEAIITRSRIRTVKQYNSFFNTMLLTSWDNMKREFIGMPGRVCGLTQSSLEQGSSVKSSSAADVYRFKSNENTLRELNSSLLLEKDFDILLKFFTGQNPYNEVPVDPKIRMCWVILDKLLNPSAGQKKDVEMSLKKGLFSDIDLKISLGSKEVQIRQEIAQRARDLLEESYLSRIASLVTGTRLDIGGLASIDRQIYAYLKRMMTRGGTWADDLEVHGDDPIWAHLFLCVRSGRKEEALKYIYSKESAFRESSEAFTECFIAFIEDGKSTRRGRIYDSLSREWNTVKKYKDIPGIDPFKYILFKIVGRFEPNSKIASNPQYMSTIEDYVWLLLCFVDESLNQDPHGEEAFGLRDVASKLMHTPTSYFDNVIDHFRTLLFCGEVELAIAQLYNVGGYEVEATHFAIAMAYVGIVSQPFESKESGTCAFEGPQITLPSGSKYNPTYLNYVKLVSDSALSCMSLNSDLALNYAYTLGLIGTNPYYVDKGRNTNSPGIACTMAAIELIKKIIVSSNTPEDIIGSFQPDGSVKQGPLRKYSALIHITTEESYNLHIISGAADIAQEKSKYPLVIHLLNVAGKYSSVIKLLNGLLSEQILLYEHPEYLMSEKIVDPEALSTPVVTMFQHRPEISASIDENLIKACVILRKLYTFARLTRQNQYEEALSILKEAGVFPFSKELGISIENARELCSLEGVSSVIPTVVRIAAKAMSALLRDSKTPTSDRIAQRVKQNRLTDIKKMVEAMVLLAGGPSNIFPKDVLSSLRELLGQIG